ncbi:deoxyribose-phosphate aldolase [Paenibacillus solisilvae]|uniref:Deoxyribose-phosphate aldolase n=1 Tax=Paenibacillus solisilvae TaxID=2486751 RepID=A0ABW0W410_9BACL
MVERWMPGSPIAAFIDHTLLKPTATEQDMMQLCEEAIQHKFHSVCVNSSWVPLCSEHLFDTGVRITAACGFPLGAAATKVKVYEAVNAVEDGADEIDIVLPIGAVIEGRYGSVAYDISAIVRAVGKAAVVKVILETGYLDDLQKAQACRVAEAAGAHYVITSTGFGPGGAAEADLRLMRASVSKSIGVKASGDIRDAQTAKQMLSLGANRLGTSAGVLIVSSDANFSTLDDNRPGERSGSLLY